jgi:EAL domain-containing protein (putative c-di-GMP-specific phosphodiesterase class I)
MSIFGPFRSLAVPAVRRRGSTANATHAIDDRMTWISSCSAPDLSSLEQPLLSNYMLNVTFLDHKISEAPRVLAWSHVLIISVDKALRSYCEGRQKLLEYVSSENKTSRLIAGLGDFETCINSTKRCLRLIDRLARDPESSGVEKTRRRLLNSVDAEITDIRDAIEHMDERIAVTSGEGGKPQLLFVTRDVFIGCSVGIALVSDPDVDSTECLRRADLALYRAKAEGRSCLVFFEEEMDASLRNRLQLREDLREGLAAGQLNLVYQPQVHHGDIYGVEALLRWEHPERGMISPAVFVPIAEQSGLIEPLGLFTLRRAFEDSHRLPGMRVAVNVSAAQLRLKDFVPNLRKVIEETGVDTRRLELEITEGLLLGDDTAVLDRLQQIRSLGFRIALDDFGTGYSSLSYLQRYPIDKIKIDRSFIANLGVEGDADAVVSAIVRLARALRLDVIAEGVETEAQRLRLAAAGCGDIQGYLFGKPMSLESVVEGFLAQVNNTTPAAPAPVATIA